MVDKKKTIKYWLPAILALLLLLAGCGTGTGKDSGTLAEMKKIGELPLQWAEEFSVDRYEGGYDVVRVSDGRTYFVIPENGSVPDSVPEDWTVLAKPLQNIDVVSSAAMDVFLKLDAMECVDFSGLPETQWYLPEVREAMAEGKILYGGKYSAPDYEQLRSHQCGVAVENTMIYHTPEVVEQLESLGIPVFVDCSSGEKTPLARMEWLRLYAILLDREELADQLLEEQANYFRNLEKIPSTGKTVAFFSINSSGEAVVRTNTDYLVSMLETAGGNYAFSELESRGKHLASTATIAMEQFYKTAKNADILIVNSALTDHCDTLEELKGKSPMFQNMKAVQNGSVYITEDSLYQSSMELGDITDEMHRLIQGQDEGLVHFRKLQ